MRESDLLKILGVPKQDLVDLRKIHPEYIKRVSRRITWTKEGIMEAFKFFDLEPEPVFALEAAVRPQPRAAKVTRTNFPNTKLIQVQAEGDLTPRMVRVRASNMYVPGMAIEIKPDGNGWTVARHPRQRGKL